MTSLFTGRCSTTGHNGQAQFCTLYIALIITKALFYRPLFQQGDADWPRVPFPPYPFPNGKQYLAKSLGLGNTSACLLGPQVRHARREDAPQAAAPAVKWDVSQAELRWESEEAWYLQTKPGTWCGPGAQPW